MNDTVYHVWPALPGSGRRRKRENGWVYTGTCLEHAGIKIDEIINRRRCPAAVASVRGNGTVFMTLFELPRSPLLSSTMGRENT